MIFQEYMKSLHILKGFVFVLFIAIVFMSCGRLADKNKSVNDSTKYIKIEKSKEERKVVKDDAIDDFFVDSDTMTFELIPKEIDTLNFAFRLKPTENYNQIKSEIKAERLRLSQLFSLEKDSLKRELILDSAKHYVTNILVNKLTPHWYGMPWSFSGYSAVPQKGEVGCSYFVSNTLLHAGFNVNRYKLAQQGPMNEAKSIDTNFVTYFNEELFSGKDVNKTVVSKVVSENKDGLYFVGLSNHVGYLLIHDKELYFIHSNYGKLAVMLEYAETSQEFVDNQYFISKITHNDDLIRKWLLNEEIRVYPD